MSAAEQRGPMSPIRPKESLGVIPVPALSHPWAIPTPVPMPMLPLPLFPWHPCSHPCPHPFGHAIAVPNPILLPSHLYSVPHCRHAVPIPLLFLTTCLGCPLNCDPAPSLFPSLSSLSPCLCQLQSHPCPLAIPVPMVTLCHHCPHPCVNPVALPVLSPCPGHPPSLSPSLC